MSFGLGTQFSPSRAFFPLCHCFVIHFIVLCLVAFAKAHTRASDASLDDCTCTLDLIKVGLFRSNLAPNLRNHFQPTAQTQDNKVVCPAFLNCVWQRPTTARMIGSGGGECRLNSTVASRCAQLLDGGRSHPSWILPFSRTAYEKTRTVMVKVLTLCRIGRRRRMHSMTCCCVRVTFRRHFPGGDVVGDSMLEGEFGCQPLRQAIVVSLTGLHSRLSERCLSSWSIASRLYWLWNSFVRLL